MPVKVKKSIDFKATESLEINSGFQRKKSIFVGLT